MTPRKPESGNGQLLQLSEDHAQQVVLRPLQKRVKKALEFSLGAVAGKRSDIPDSPTSVGPLSGLLDSQDSPTSFAPLSLLNSLPNQPPQGQLRRKSLSSRHIQQLQQQLETAANRPKQPPQKKAKKAGDTPGTGKIGVGPTPPQKDPQNLAWHPAEMSSSKRSKCTPSSMPLSQASTRPPSSVPMSQASSQPMSQPETAARQRASAPTSQGSIQPTSQPETSARQRAPAPMSQGNMQPMSQPETSARQREREGREHAIAVTCVAQLVSDARRRLEAMVDIDGVQQQLDEFPDVKLLGEEHANKMCRDRMPKWITGMERIGMVLTKSLREYEEMARVESGRDLLRRVHAAGLGFSGALQRVVSGTPCCSTTAMTLNEELREFSAAVSSSTFGISTCLTGKEASIAAEELWSSFNGIESYTAYLHDQIGIASTDVPLSGGAAWHRLTKEVEIAMRLVHPSAKQIQELASAAVQSGGTGVHGNQCWDDVAAKLLIEIAYDPLMRRIRYVVARVSFALQKLRSSVVELMATAGERPSSFMYSPLFSQHLQIVKSGPIARDLIFSAFDKAADNVATMLLKHLQASLNAMCLNPRIVRRPSTVPDHPSEIRKPCQPKDARSRVKAEMKLRSGYGLLTSLNDLTFNPSEASQGLPSVQQDLCQTFKIIANLLANQTAAFADTSILVLCNRQLDTSMNAIQLSQDQRLVLDARERELQANAAQARRRLGKVQQCTISMKSALSVSLEKKGGA